MRQAAHAGFGKPRARRRANPLAMPMILFVAVSLLSAGYVAYVLWPRWPAGNISVDAPAIPVLVAGAAFNVEPAAIRQRMQRRPGVHERLDIAYLWPSLLPPDPANKGTQEQPINANDRLFITIANGEMTLPFPERVQTIYPRYLAPTTSTLPNGLTLRAFRDGTPYQGEDLIANEASFVARCTRTGVGNSGSCLYERRIGNADMTLRFPRDWLDDAATTVARLEGLVTRLHAGRF